MLTRSFKYLKVSLDGQTSLNSFDELTFGRMKDEIGRSTCQQSQSGTRDEVKEKLDKDEPTSKQPCEQVKIQAIWEG